MAYGLKYKASKTHENGDKYEVRIYRDGWTGVSYGIGNLTRLSLSIQGDTAALTAPIIKTSLNIGMIDTPDKGSTKSDGTTCVDANGDKVGKWEEFYTNNPTLYKVELRYTGALTRNAVIWTGFLTPDSWGEDMTYGGTISLVARDMLGTLSEYEFDLTGDVTITQIVQGALTKCKCAMTATMRTSECLQNAGNSQSILTAKINASTFAGKSWYEALEQTLEGVGLILRYDGNNGFDCTSIRYAASHAVEGGENAHTPAFYNRSGYRTLDPAVKQIVEVFNPSIESIAPVEPGADDWTDTGQTLTQKFKNHLGQESTYSYPKMSLSAQGVDYSGTGALPYYENTYIYNGTTGELIPTFRAPLYIPINLQSSADFLTLKNAAFVPPFNLSFSNPMGSTGYLLFTPAEGSSPRVLTNTYSRDFEQKVRFRITCKKNGTTYYWDTSGAGAWGTTEKVLEYVTGERIQVAELEGATDYAIGVNTVVVPAPASATDFYPARAAFIPLVYEVAPIDGNDVYGEYKTTTIYDEENHIEINRTPSIGAINSSTPAAFLPNVLHYGTTPASDKWRWAGENSAGLPLAVVIHQQLLVFNCAQNGNSIFTGDLIDMTSRVSVPGTNYDYFTRSCALLAGDYNCLSGYIEGVTLREIYEWDDVWDGVTPEYTEKESQAKGGTAASGGGGSSSGGGGGSSHTHPNKEVLDGITAEKVTSWDGAVTLAHSHDNKTILDAIQEASITHWDAAYSHSQIGVAATTPSGNPHNTTWAQIYSASGNAKILTDYIGDGQITTDKIADLAVTTGKIADLAITEGKIAANAVTIAKLESALSWLSHCHYSNGTLVLGDENNAINFAAYGEVTAGGVGSGGSGGTGALYTCADVTAYNNSKVGRSTTEGAQVGDLLAYDGTHWHAVVAPATGVTAIKVNGGAAQTGEVSLTIPSAVTENTVSGWGFTKNTGTVTQIKVGSTAYNPVSGAVSLPAYPTALPASDVSAWAKAATKPSYSYSEISGRPTKLSDLTDDVVSGHYQPLDADLTAIAALTGTSGHLKKTAANTWTLDTDVATKTYVGGALSPYRTSANQDTITNALELSLAASIAALDGRLTSVEDRLATPSLSELLVGNLGIKEAINLGGYDITLAKVGEWDAKQDAINDLATIRSRADEGHTAYGWGNWASRMTNVESRATSLESRATAVEGRATTLEGYFSGGIAKRATADASGNVITTTYQTIAHTDKTELALSAGVAGVESRLASIEQWMRSMSADDLLVKVLNIVKILNIGGIDIKVNTNGEVEIAGNVRATGNITLTGNVVAYGEITAGV